MNSGVDNVGAGALNYRFFCASNRPPFQTNTRMYSIILINNSVPFRWEGRYNEDSILSMRMLKAGWQTVQLNTFLANKAATQTVPGGNNKDFYEKEGTNPKSQMFKDIFPNEVELVERWGRPHHFVDWKRLFGLDFFGNKGKCNEYGLYLKSDERSDIYPQCLI